MFAEVSGISSVLSGRGEQGVRSQGHAQQLARLGSSRAKRRALQVEESLEKIATLYMKVMQAYDKTQYQTEDGLKFIAEQIHEGLHCQGRCSFQLSNLHGGFAAIGV